MQNVLRELVNISEYEAVVELPKEVVAGMVRADDPFPHGKCFSRGSCHHITGAGIQKDPAASRGACLMQAQ